MFSYLNIELLMMNDKIQQVIDTIDHPLKMEMVKVITIIQNANPKIESSIKWGGPSFSFKGDMATINQKICYCNISQGITF